MAVVCKKREGRNQPDEQDGQQDAQEPAVEDGAQEPALEDGEEGEADDAQQAVKMEWGDSCVGTTQRHMSTVAVGPSQPVRQRRKKQRTQ